MQITAGPLLQTINSPEDLKKLSREKFTRFVMSFVNILSMLLAFMAGILAPVLA
jgi:hypothetical protein